MRFFIRTATSKDGTAEKEKEGEKRREGGDPTELDVSPGGVRSHIHQGKLTLRMKLSVV